MPNQTGTTMGTRQAAMTLVALCVGFPATVFVGATWYDYRNSMGQASARAEATASTLSEHAQAVFETLGMAIDRVADRKEGMGWDDVSASPAFGDFLRNLKHDLPQVMTIYLADARGTMRASSGPLQQGAATVADREYFSVPMATGRITVTTPFVSRVNGQETFALSKPIYVDGRFEGVIAVSVEEAYFREFYGQALRVPGSRAMLTRDDGALLFTYPQGGVGNVVDQGKPSASTGQGDDARIESRRRLRKVPVVVDFTIDRGAVLGGWLWRVGAFGTLAAMAAGALTLATRMTMLRSRIAEEALRRLLTETERRQKAEAILVQSQKMDAVGRLTGGVAHDFNNILTGVIGAIDLLRTRRREADAKEVRLMTIALESAHRGKTLVEQLMAFSRREDVRLRPVDLNASLRKVRELLGRTTGKEVAIAYDLADDAWPAHADEVQVETAVLNLANNARDAMPNGGTITLRSANVTEAERAATPQLGEGEWVCVAVSDDGIGMPPEIAGKAFDPFFTTKEKGKGTGLGLSMVFGVASSAGGTATIRSAPGRGTTVTMFLRRAEGLPAEAGAEADDLVVRAPTGFRVLLVDDDEHVREVMAETFARSGAQVTTAASGAEGLSILGSLKDGGFDCIVTDYAMPGMTGAEFANEVMRTHPHMPMCFVTGYADEHALTTHEARGMRIVRKPFRPRDLAEAAFAARSCGRVEGTRRRAQEDALILAPSH